MPSLLLACFFMIGLVHTDTGHFSMYLNPLERIVCAMVFFILFGLIIYNRANFLKQRWLFAMGAISYALYLIHDSLAINIIVYLSGYMNNTLAISSALLISIIGALLITYKFEKPVHQWIWKKYNSPHK